MKKIFISLLMALMGCTVVQADNTSITSKGDTMMVVEDGDTTRIVGSVAKIVNGITHALDDTVMSSAVGAAEDWSDQDEAEFRRDRMEQQRTMRGMVENVVTYIAGACVGICFISLLFYYLHRRAKYRMMEKAIENNYPLPGTPLPSSSCQQPGTSQQPPVYVSQNDQPLSSNPLPLPAHVSLDFSSIKSQLNWNAFSKSFILMAVGIALMLFFLFAGSLEMMALMSILPLIGLAKAFTIYQDQKRWIAQQRWQAQQPVGSQQAPPQQPAATDQPPVFNKDNHVQ